MLPGLGIAWLCLIVVLIVTAYACSEERRSHFAARLVALLLTPPALVGILVAGYESGVIAGGTGLVLLVAVLFLVLPGVMLAPAVLFKDARSSSDGDGGRGSGPDDPQPEPEPPRGGVPLPDAEQAAARARDHNRPWRVRRPSRRSSPEPERPRSPIS